jgi:hypothetical protein
VSIGPEHHVSTPKRVGLAIATALVSVNIWTGSPLFAIWVGSRVQASIGALSMTAVFIVLVVLVVESVVLLKALALLSQRYDRVLGRKTVRAQAPWLRPISGERASSLRAKRPLTAVERTVVASVVIAVMLSEVWFFFFAGSSLGQG